MPALQRRAIELLSDDELNAFQRLCFNQPLAPTELAGVKEVVGSNSENGIQNNCITRGGFLALHQLFIERGRLETT